MQTQQHKSELRVVPSIPARAGIGLRAEHYEDVLKSKPNVGWFEVHSENYFGIGGKPFTILEKIRQDYPISLHGVGLSLGSVDPLDGKHLTSLKRLIDCVEPGLVSEHISWSAINGKHLHDLLPLPYTEEALAHLVTRIGRVQDYLGRRILVENLSSYVQFRYSTMSEWEFINELAQRSGCGVLLDVNNVYVSANNHQFDPYFYIDSICADAVMEIHLAGHKRRQIDGSVFIIDTHDRVISAEVWSLYRHATNRLGSMPVLIEWDANMPTLETLVREANHAQQIMEQQYALTA